MVTDKSFIQGQLNKQATELNTLKINLLLLKQKIAEIEIKETLEKNNPASYFYPVLIKQTTKEELEKQEQALITEIKTRQANLKTDEEKNKLVGAIDFNSTSSSLYINCDENQQKANKLANDLQKKNKEIILLDNVIDTKRNSPNIENYIKLKDTLCKNRDEINNILTGMADSGTYGFAVNEQIIADNTLTRYIPLIPDYCDDLDYPSPAPEKLPDNTSVYSFTKWGAYGYNYAAHTLSPWLHEVGKHVALDEFKEPHGRFAKAVDVIFGTMVLGFILYGAYEYVGYENGTATSGEAATTLAACTYGLAAIGLAYTLALLYGTVRDKQDADSQRPLNGDKRIHEIKTPKAYDDHIASATISFAASFFLVCGFVYMSAEQYDDINLSVPGIMLAPIAALLIAYATQQYKEALEAAAKENYQSQTIWQRLNENPIAAAVAVVGLAIIYNGAVGLAAHRHDAEALGGDIELMVRMVGLLFAAAGLASGLQKTIKARNEAEYRKNQYNNDIHNPCNREEKYLYLEDGKLTLYTHKKVDATQPPAANEAKKKDEPSYKTTNEVTLLEATMDKTGRRTDGLLHLALGGTALLIYAYFASQKDMSAELKIATVVCSALAGIFFKKFGTNMEKHYDKIGRITTSYEFREDSKSKEMTIRPTVTCYK